ncbi:ribosome maturation factor RimP [Psittacicella melopsittaci]|uniref:Ribosome maturation factor RimP n=1 Tax=Psittacicella melopsittaci TaxID=2028576 RepID=A0A3A1Y432_9GAMM|nr:ribosome maturation factor RimP [Psittacicella melopsittaci]RIY33003.1 ribosome maturation factor RimP [Psittacicella melopsittaci]
MASIQDRIKEMIKPTVESLGYDLWGVEYIKGKHPTLLVFIDKEGGIVIEDCEIASDAISPLLDVEDPIESEYDLEVSSPGLDRPLFTLEQFAKYIDQPVVVHLRMAQQSRRKFTGKIVEVSDNIVKIDTSYVKPKPGKKVKPGKALAKNKAKTNEDQDPIVEIMFSNILKANLDPVIDLF